MKENVIVQLGGRFYHPEEFAAPIGWRRISGERVYLERWGLPGRWCEILNDQFPFVFQWCSGHIDLLIVEGFTNRDLNGAVIPYYVALGPDKDLKAWMKDRGLPRCTRGNLRRDVRKFLNMTVSEDCISLPKGEVTSAWSWERRRDEVKDLPRKMERLANNLNLGHIWIGDMYLVDVLQHLNTLVSLKEAISRYEEKLRNRGDTLSKTGAGSSEETESEKPQRVNTGCPPHNALTVCQYMERGPEHKRDEIEEMTRDGDSRVIEYNTDARKETAE